MSKTEKHEPAAPVAAAEPKPSGGILRLAVIALGIFVVVTAECLAAYFLLPSASDLAAAAESRLVEKTKVEQAEEKEPEEVEESPTVEVDLGTFNVSTHVPATGTTLRVDFRLAGIVAEADKALFEELLAKHHNRLRDRVIFEIRSASVADLSDPGLGLIKRRILAKVNASLGKPILRGVIVSEFSFVGS